MYRIVLDPQTIISYLKAKEESHAHKIIAESIASKVQSILTEEHKKEIEALADETIEEREMFDLLEEYLKIVESAEIKTKAKVLEDKIANSLLALAEIGDADFIISENSNLLDLDEYRGIQMVTPEQFWSMYQEDNNTGDDDEGGWAVWQKNQNE